MCFVLYVSLEFDSLSNLEKEVIMACISIIVKLMKQAVALIIVYHVVLLI